MTTPATSSATKRAKSKVKAKIFTQLMFRHWTSYFDGKYSHLFIVSAGLDWRAAPST